MRRILYLYVVERDLKETNNYLFLKVLFFFLLYIRDFKRVSVLIKFSAKTNKSFRKIDDYL